MSSLFLLTIQPAHADSEKTGNASNGHYYQKFYTKKTWVEARDVCASKGAYLATINSAFELAWLKSQKLSAYVFVGATDIGACGFGGCYDTHGDWKWITGEVFEYADTLWSYKSDKTGKLGYDFLYLGDAGKYSYAKSSAVTSQYLCEWNSQAEADTEKAATDLTTVPTSSLKELSWDIPKQQDCSASRLKTSSDTLTSAMCFNTESTKIATVKISPNTDVVGQETKMVITLNPLSNSGAKMGYLFKIAYPAELKAAISVTNTEPLSKDAEVPEILMDVRDDIIDGVLGQFSSIVKYAWKYLGKPETAGDPSFLNKLPDYPVLSRQEYPYQTVVKHFQRADENAPMSIIMFSPLPFATFKDILDARGISFYLGSDVTREILVEKMVSAK